MWFSCSSFFFQSGWSLAQAGTSRPPNRSSATARPFRPGSLHVVGIVRSPITTLVYARHRTGSARETRSLLWSAIVHRRRVGTGAGGTIDPIPSPILAKMPFSRYGNRPAGRGSVGNALGGVPGDGSRVGRGTARRPFPTARLFAHYAEVDP